MLAKFQRLGDGSEVVYEVSNRWRRYPVERMKREGTILGVKWKGHSWKILWGKKWQRADGGDRRMLAGVPMTGEIQD